jgi:hypothetical protein
MSEPATAARAQGKRPCGLPVPMAIMIRRGRRSPRRIRPALSSTGSPIEGAARAAYAQRTMLRALAETSKRRAPIAGTNVTGTEFRHGQRDSFSVNFTV